MFFCCSSISTKSIVLSVEIYHCEYWSMMPSLSWPCKVLKGSLLVTEATLETALKYLLAKIFFLLEWSLAKQIKKQPQKNQSLALGFYGRSCQQGLIYVIDINSTNQHREQYWIHTKDCVQEDKEPLTMKNIWIKWLVIGQKMLQKNKGKWKHQVLFLKPFIKCHDNGIDWTWRKTLRWYDGTGLSLRTHHKTELLSWTMVLILLFSPCNSFLPPWNLRTVIIEALKSKKEGYGEMWFWISVSTYLS